ncbi:MAG: GTP-binding protein [Anaerolineales bacterium]
MLINWKLRELNLKLVYYGPAFSGKTTNLIHIHSRVAPERRSNLVSLKTQEDRTLYFDFLQLELGKINGLTPKIHLYTVPGQAIYESSRRLVLRGADGVVFVADSGAQRLEDNIDSWKKMQDHLSSFGIYTVRFPTVVQFNKRDDPHALESSEIAKELGVNGFPTFESVATKGEGVFETLKSIIGSVMSNLQRELTKA